MRWYHATLVGVLALGCNRNNSISTTGDPPFEIKNLKSVLWAQDPSTDAREGAAALVLSDEQIGCDQLTAHDVYSDLDELTLDGQGLMFLLAYDSWGNDVAPQDWEGLWMTGYAYGGGGAERMMYPMAFSDGFIYFLGGWYGIGDSSWLDIIAYASGGVNGRYSTEYWAGDFYAENCGDWGTGGPGFDTGW